MLAVVATLKIKPGTERDFEAVAKQLVEKVNALEPGCKLYTLCKGDTPLTYVFLERYVDEDATKAHRGSDHFKELGRKMGAFMEGPPQVLRLVEV
jgi:quinol monooxygenase YgiN